MQSRTMNMSSFTPIGVCLDMCSERERREREQHRRLHPFEMQSRLVMARTFRNKAHALADPSRTVKEYSRPAAGKELSSPRDLRTPETLLKTVHYLLMEIWENNVEREVASLALAYPFVFDRLRAVRQDLTIQRIRGSIGARVLEGALGFLLCAPYLVRELPLDVYSEVLHSTQVRESFSDLMECYRGSGKFPRQAEFQALLLLYDLGNRDAMNRTLHLPRNIHKAPQVRLALAINRAYLECNWVRLFRLVHQLDCLQACTFYRHLTDCRDQALRTYTHAFSSPNCRFPLDHLTFLLAVDSPLIMAEMCKRRGLTVTSGEQASVLFYKASYKTGELECPGKEINLVEMRKGDVSWADVMAGQEEVH
ncbi:SAC3 domain-containing protein 1 [Gastrophryne carolinensis]